MARHWTREEVEATVADYFGMLEKELRGEPFNKAAHRRALMAFLDQRSATSIERKHQNISAILIELGYPYIFGYKPLGNYQRLLAEIVAERVIEDRALDRTVQEAVVKEATVPPVSSFLDRLEQPPESGEFVYPPFRRAVTDGLISPRVNYLEREAHNASLGRAGEEFVIAFERARLQYLDRGNLADRVEHIAANVGDGAGFDIRSFEENGEDRLIEVKTTAYGKQTPFFLSRNEVDVSRERASRYHLYRVFRFRQDPRLYTVNGSLERICRLEAVQFRARIA